MHSYHIKAFFGSSGGLFSGGAIDGTVVMVGHENASEQRVPAIFCLHCVRPSRSSEWPPLPLDEGPGLVGDIQAKERDHMAQ